MVIQFCPDTFRAEETRVTSGLRNRQGRLLGGGGRKEAGSCRVEVWEVLGQSPHWPFCSLGKGSGQSLSSLPGDLEGRGLWSCQVISGLELPFLTSSHYHQRIISIFRQLNPSFRNYNCFSWVLSDSSMYGLWHLLPWAPTTWDGWVQVPFL